MWELQISAGTGPAEAQRFVVLLADELARRCADAGLELIDPLPDADRATSVNLRVRGDRAAIAEQLGTHALICDSRRARTGRHRGHRKRWFVQVCAHANEATNSTSCEPPAVDPSEVELAFCRAGGPGGQHVNKSSTAVRATHRPTGVAVRVSESRSQAHNRELALARLAAQLGARSRATAQQRSQARREQALAVERGNPVATWRLDTRANLRRV